MNSDLTLLLDCSSMNVQWGLAKNDRLIVKEILDRESNADSLISTIRSRFVSNSFKVSDISFVVVSNGPGSFTGLRISAAIAKGICLSTGAKLVEVNSLDVLANKFSPTRSSSNVIPLINTNMKSGELYYSVYQKGDSLKRISDYGIIFKNELTKLKGMFIADKNIAIDDKNITSRIVIALRDNIESLHDLGLKKINAREFSDINNSEPFYIKIFEPVTKKKQIQ